MQLSLAYSTCPNDTFIFHALTHGLVDSGGLSFDVILKDVEALNTDAKNGLFDISKLSFAAIGHLSGTYRLLNAGAALGRGCGPLVISRPGFDLSGLKNARIAVPGMWTTASLLLSLFLEKQPGVTPMTFDKIMPAVQRGEFDFGVIIHEGRFTYAGYGLECLIDLGQWWEDKTGLPIPLGGIAVRRDMAPDIAGAVEEGIRKSVQFAFEHPEKSKPYIKRHAQELADAVISQHINLYVNDFSIDLGDTGHKAVDTLFSLAEKSGIMKHPG